MYIHIIHVDCVVAIRPSVGIYDQLCIEKDVTYFVPFTTISAHSLALSHAGIARCGYERARDE